MTFEDAQKLLAAVYRASKGNEVLAQAMCRALQEEFPDLRFICSDEMRLSVMDGEEKYIHEEEQEKA